MDITKIVGLYIQLRDRKAEIKAEYDLKVASIDEAQQKAEAAILHFFNTSGGVDSIKTPSGTVYKSSRSSATIADWDAYWAFITKTENFQLIERRAAKKAVEEYKNATGELPPGINWSEETTVNFRR